MDNGVLKIATCQFAVSGSVKHNSEKICKLIEDAKDGGADIAWDAQVEMVIDLDYYIDLLRSMIACLSSRMK